MNDLRNRLGASTPKSELSFGETFNKVYIPAVLGVMAFTTSLTTLYTSRLDTASKKSQEQAQYLIEIQKDRRADRELISKLDLDLYDRVREAVTREHVNGAEGRALITLIGSLADGDFKTGLGQIVFDATNDPSVKAEAASTVYASDNSSAPPTTAQSQSRWGNWNIDLFWCQSSGAAAQAMATKALGLNDDGGTGRWRVRILPDSINAQPGYNVSGFQVRSEASIVDPKEAELGEEIRKELQRMIGTTVMIQSPANRTPHYISAFFCPKSIR